MPKPKVKGIVKDIILNDTFALGGVVLSEAFDSGDSFIELGKNVDLATLTKGDEEPMFITEEVLHEGVSKNGYYYDRSFIEALKQQVLDRKPNGYKGHIPNEKLSSATPDAYTVWVGAGTKEIDGKLTAFVKGYILKSKKGWRDYLKSLAAIGRSAPLSIKAGAKAVFSKTLNAYKAYDLDLWSIDFARDRSEGMPSLTGKMLITSEMTDINLDDGKMDYKDITLEALKSERPELVSQIEKDSQPRILAEMQEVLGVDEDSKIPVAIAKTIEENSELKVKLQEMRVSSAENAVKAEIKKLVADTGIAKAVEYHVLSEMTDEVLLSENLSDKLREMFKSDEIVSLLKLKKSHVPSSEKDGDISVNSVTKRVPISS